MWLLCVATPARAESLTERLANDTDGPFEIAPCTDLAEAGRHLSASTPFDALIIESDTADLAGLLAWPGLMQAVAEGIAVVLVADGAVAVPIELATRLLQQGVQDLIDPDDGAPLGRRLRLAIERERHAATQRYAHLTDPATGLPTRQQLVDHMHHLVALRDREPAPMGLLALRVEGLHTVQATLGAASASLLRRKIAVRVRGVLRASDVVASLGVDLFGVLLAAIDRPEHVEQVANKLQAAIQRPFSIGGQAHAVASSIGIRVYPRDGGDASVLLGDALASATERPALGRVGLANWHERGAAAPPAANDE